MSNCTFHVLDQNTARHMVNKFLKCLFNATVYMEFQVCFSFAKYEKDRLSLCETTKCGY